MTAAHHAVLRYLHDCLMSLDDLVLRHGPTLPEELGNVEFRARTITLDPAQSFEEWVHTLAHELVHLNHGPSYLDEVEQDEQNVIEETARLLVPRDALPAILEAARPAAIAAALGVDEPTVRLSLDLARQDRDNAARERPETEDVIA